MLPNEGKHDKAGRRLSMRDVIMQGDCLQVLKTLPDESVQCVVTSPPYFGLRDYGTGQWVGGSPECDHDAIIKGKALAQVGNSLRKATDHPGQINAAIAVPRYCPSCGATRQDQQIGLEETPAAYVARLVEVFREVKRVLRRDGVLWLNLGDSYGGAGDRSAKRSSGDHPRGCASASCTLSKPKMPKVQGLSGKDMLGMPWKVAFALQEDGWVLRSDVIWHKPNCMPESVRDRPTKSHEYLFLFAKSERYFYDGDAIREDNVTATNLRNKSAETYGARAYLTPLGAGPREWNNPQGRNKRTVWTIATSPYKEAHFATFPPALVEPCILAGSRPGDVVLDPFMGAGTVGMVAKQHKRHYLGIELNASYITMAEKRIAEATKPRAKIIKLRQPVTDVKQLSLFA
jgi:DNA modification methylase